MDRKSLIFSVLITAGLLILLSSCAGISSILGPTNKPPEITFISPQANEIVEVEEPRELTLEWDVTDPEGHAWVVNVYFGESGSLEKIVDGETVTSTTVTVDYGKTYGLRIEAIDSQGASSTAEISFFTGKGIIRVVVVAFNSGPAVEGAEIVVKDGDTGETIATGTTDENGVATFNVSDFPEGVEMIDVEAKKYGYALSAVRGVKVEKAREKAIEMIMKEAKLNSDPDSETLPDVTLEFLTIDGSPLDLNNVEGPFQVKVSVDSEEHVQLIYLALGRVPGSSFFGPRSSVPNTSEATFTVVPEGWSGETELHVVVYDYNDNRVNVVEYLNIVNEEEAPEKMYEPIPWSIFGYPNLLAFTRGDAAEFFGKGFERLMEKFSPDTAGPMAAPEGANLWVEVGWMDYWDAYWYLNPEIPEPDGYNVYRSFDGKHFQKIGFTTDDYYIDQSSMLSAGKKVWYAVSSVYGGVESEKVILGSVEPLDIFNLVLLEPEDGATNVSAQPTFVWAPDRELSSSEGDVKFHYSVVITDMVQSENYLLPLEANMEDVYEWVTEEATVVEAPFVSNEYLWIHSGYGEVGRLEYNKTYSWGPLYAYAEVEDEDSAAVSLACDLWGYDPLEIGVMPEKFNEFTTGTE